jgi:hypothetical protein
METIGQLLEEFKKNSDHPLHQKDPCGLPWENNINEQPYEAQLLNKIFIHYLLKNENKGDLLKLGIAFLKKAKITFDYRIPSIWQEHSNDINFISIGMIREASYQSQKFLHRLWIVCPEKREDIQKIINRDAYHKKEGLKKELFELIQKVYNNSDKIFSLFYELAIKHKIKSISDIDCPSMDKKIENFQTLVNILDKSGYLINPEKRIFWEVVTQKKYTNPEHIELFKRLKKEFWKCYPIF